MTDVKKASEELCKLACILFAVKIPDTILVLFTKKVSTGNFFSDSFWSGLDDAVFR